MNVSPGIAVPRVYLPQLDEEHLQLIRALEELHSAIDSGARAPKIEFLLARMVEEVAAHFAHEEGLMRTSRYPEYEWHSQQHGTASRKIKTLIGQVRHTSRSSISQSLDSFAAWLKFHVGIADRMASAHLRNHARETAGLRTGPASKNAKLG